MKVIGFAGKYYTLWEVTSSTTDFCNGKHCIIKSYTYLQNISFDKEKVFAMYPNIEIDEELRGRTKSFKSYKEYWDNIDTFRFGKYVGKKITDVNDVHYTVWYWGNIYDEHKDFVSQFLYDHGYEIRTNTYTNYYGEVITSEYLVTPDVIAKELRTEENKHEIIKKLQNNEVLTINPKSNIDSDAIWVGDANVIYKFPGVAEYYYQGFEYYLPVLNGKSKRIKNKNVEIDKYTFEIKDDGQVIINIINFKVLK